jgi:tetratricopeptide (TPR) repeat protein
MTASGGATAATGEVIVADFRTTEGVLALVNLEAQIDGQERRAAAGELDVSGKAEFIELVALRGHVLGCIADYEWAERLAEQLVSDAPSDGVAFLARARARGTFHRFTDALTDLDEAQRLGADTMVLDTERAAILQAIGQYEQALIIFRDAAARRADFNSLGALATHYAERGASADAEHFFNESRKHYRGVSPFPLALLEFRHALMWLAQGELHRARTWLGTAHSRLPAYAPAQGHLAEVEAALGDNDSAIARLRPLTISSDDPDYAAQLARILDDLGRVEEALEWRNKAATRYEELIASHPAAFADHAAEFWLEAGADPARACTLARVNLANRQTLRAFELAYSSAVAAGNERFASDLSVEARMRWGQTKAFSRSPIAEAS